jgi:hypothetical protein
MDNLPLIVAIFAIVVISAICSGLNVGPVSANRVRK